LDLRYSGQLANLSPRKRRAQQPAMPVVGLSAGPFAHLPAGLRRGLQENWLRRGPQRRDRSEASQFGLAPVEASSDAERPTAWLGREDSNLCISESELPTAGGGRIRTYASQLKQVCRSAPYSQTKCQVMIDSSGSNSEMQSFESWLRVSRILILKSRGSNPATPATQSVSRHRCSPRPVGCVSLASAQAGNRHQ
jgi:hypothetical protein